MNVITFKANSVLPALFLAGPRTDLAASRPDVSTTNGETS